MEISRIYGKLKLPVPQKCLNVVFGNDSPGNEPGNNVHVYEESIHPEGKTFNKTQSRESNPQPALCWSDVGRRSGIRQHNFNSHKRLNYGVHASGGPYGATGCLCKPNSIT